MGGKTVLPMRFFTDNFNKHYYEEPTLPENQVATSHGVPMKGRQMTGPDLHIAEPLKQNGGGVLPAEYFGGNSGRYFEEGSPELLNCETAYGRVIPRSHGVVMDHPNGNWMGPNLASFPNATTLQTGGGGCKTMGNKKKKHPKKKNHPKKKKGGGYGMGCGCGPGKSKKSTKKKSTKKKKGGGYGKKTKRGKQLKRY